VAEVSVKICGLTREQDVEAAVAAGADMVGFVIVPSSPRGLDPDRARELARGVPEGVRSVAVYADLDMVPEDVHDHFDLLQVYGIPRWLVPRDAWLLGAGWGVPDDGSTRRAGWMKPVQGRSWRLERPRPVPEPRSSWNQPSKRRERVIVAFRGPPPGPLPDGVLVLLDRPKGVVAELDELRRHWQAAAAVRAPVMVAGGLDPDNVGEAVRTAKPWAVDTARGVESAPGIKDPALIERFIHNAKDAA
jgi:phosphoribosylanthranilate isomerase